MKNFASLAIAFGVGVVGFVIVVILLQSILTSSPTNICTNTAHIYNESTGSCNLATNVSQISGPTFAGNITKQGLTFSNNFSSQWGLAGTILGYVLVLGILALIGVGAYAGWNKVRGSR